jgi:hypothetical protein
MAPPPSSRPWVSPPETGDEAVLAATGRGWDAWCDVIDASPVRDDGHGAIAAHVQSAHGVDAWWAQTVALGYERITGRRLPHQQPDGTFSMSASRTLALDADGLRARLEDADARATLFPGQATGLRSRPGTRNVRLALDEGTVEVALTPKAGGRTMVAVQHAKLPSPEAVTRWKSYWAAWLDGLAS